MIDAELREILMDKGSNADTIELLHHWLAKVGAAEFIGALDYICAHMDWHDPWIKTQKHPTFGLSFTSDLVPFMDENKKYVEGILSTKIGYWTIYGTPHPDYKGREQVISELSAYRKRGAGAGLVFGDVRDLVWASSYRAYHDLFACTVYQVHSTAPI